MINKIHYLSLSNINNNSILLGIFYTYNALNLYIKQRIRKINEQ